MRLPLLAVLLIGAALRLWDLGNPEPGVYRDEVIEGLHGVYHSRALLATGSAWISFSRVPVWELLMTISVGLLGPTIIAIRLPAALCGIGAIWLLYAGIRKIAGRGPALLASGLLATSFWSVLVTRIGQPPALVTLQAATLLWLVTTYRGLPGLRTSLALGLVAASGIFTYYGALTLPLIACWIVWTRARSSREPVPHRRILISLVPALAAIVVVASLSLWRTDLLGDFHRHAIINAPDTAWRLGRYLRVLALPTPPEMPDAAYWGIYPRGWPLLSPVESGFALLGLLALRESGPGRWLALAAIGWTILGLLPAAAAAGLVFHRATAVMIPMAMLQAAGLLRLGSRAPRMAPILAAAAVALNAGWTLRTYFSMYRHDPRVALWSDGVDTRVALDIKRRAAKTPLLLANSLAYGDSPALAYLLDREIASGRVRSFTPPVNPKWSVEAIYREPLQHQPLVVLFELHGLKSSDPAYMVAAPPVLLGAGITALGRGNPRAAIAHFNSVLRLLPDYGPGWAHLAAAYAAAGLPDDAARARSEAERLGIAVH